MAGGLACPSPGGGAPACPSGPRWARSAPGTGPRTRAARGPGAAGTRSAGDLQAAVQGPHGSLLNAPEPRQPKHTPNPRTPTPNTTHRPVPLLDTPQPGELEPRESEAAEAPLLDGADSPAEQRSSRSRRSSRSLDAERASLFWASEGPSCCRNWEQTPGQHPARGDGQHEVAQGKVGLPG